MIECEGVFDVRRRVSQGLFGCKILIVEDKLGGNDNEMGKIALDDDGLEREKGETLFYLFTHLQSN